MLIQHEEIKGRGNDKKLEKKLKQMFPKNEVKKIEWETPTSEELEGYVNYDFGFNHKKRF